MSFLEVIQVYGFGAAAVLAFMVNIIVELTKNIGPLKNVPTSAYTTVVSVLLSGISYFALIGVLGVSFAFHEFILSVLAGFPVAYIAMFGWEKLSEIWKRFKK